MSPPLRYLLVDGHSVIFAVSQLNYLHSRNTAKARQELIRRLGMVHDSGKWLVTLVFDGHGRSTVEPEPGEMVVLYSQRDQTADSIIERIVGQQKERSNILVVTADHAERLTIESLGAQTASPEWLVTEMQSLEGEMEAELERIHRREKW